MPAGDQIDADWQVEIGGLLTGAGTQYTITAENIGGLGTPTAKPNDLDLNHAAGAYLGHDYTGARLITIPYTITGTSPSDAGELALELSEAWAASEVDVELHIRLPGFGHVSFVGRPRGLPLDLRNLKSGVIDAFGTFFCGDPTMNVEGS